MSSTSSPALYSPSKMEAKCYYAGLPSTPKLIFRTGTTPWKEPTGPEAYRVLKELKPVFDHKIVTVWKVLGPKIIRHLDSLKVMWTSIDSVRLAEVGKAPGPVVLWIGVTPESLSGEDAFTAARGCLALLKECDITDVEVEFRESIYTRSAGPKLLKPIFDVLPTVEVRGPLTPVLGLRIAAEHTPFIEGTGSLYISEGGNSNKIFLVTARHVVFPPNEGPNDDYARTNDSQCRREVLLLGTQAFKNLLEWIKDKIDERDFLFKQELAALLRRGPLGNGEDVEEAEKEGMITQSTLNKEAMNTLEKFHDDVTENWSNASQRVLGHVVRSPPIALGVGTEGYTEDYAIIELDSSKFDKKAFKGNVIDLGTTIPRGTFRKKMYPRSKAGKTFEYPLDRLLKLQDPLKEDEMCHPDMFDHDGERCLFVIKNGNTTGVTIGCATGIFSYVREYSSDGTNQTSTEWSILPYDYKSRFFSDVGDSGSIIVDGFGRIGGLLTGGAGKPEFSDITYATPFVWLFQRIKANGFPDAHLNPVIA